MAAFSFYLCIFVFTLCAKVNGRSLGNLNIDPSIDTGVSEYLQKFGYMSKTDPNDVGILSSDPDISESLGTFQQWNNLPVTGRLDAATKKLMSTPRCGVPDPPVLPGMPKPYVLGPKWTKNTLTYKISNFSPDLSSTVIRSETARAFKFWTDVANLGISETSGTADIDILFASGDHGDGAPFDGAGGVLAHAWFPEDGRCHFDDGETWVANRTGIDYFSVAAHEIGHLLGLDHSNFQSALMYPYYRGYIPNYTIDSDDSAAIIAQYGAATTTTSTTTTTTTTTIPTPITSTEKVTMSPSMTTTDEIITTQPTTTREEITTNIPTTYAIPTTSNAPTTDNPRTTSVQPTSAATTTSVERTSSTTTTDSPITTSVQGTTVATTINVGSTSESQTTDVILTTDKSTANEQLTTKESPTTEILATFPQTTSDAYLSTKSSLMSSLQSNSPMATDEAHQTTITDTYLVTFKPMTSDHMTTQFSTPETENTATDMTIESHTNDHTTWTMAPGITDEKMTLAVSRQTVSEEHYSRGTDEITAKFTTVTIEDNSTTSVAAELATPTISILYFVTSFSIISILEIL